MPSTDTGLAAVFYDGYCNTCDMPVENGTDVERSVLQS
jgi:predicted DCC family thiol-disulfide oxidoreductase YuxK